MVENTSAELPAESAPRADDHGLKYQSALPMRNGRLAMLLFLSTELMFFAAILGTFVVLRLPAGQSWPQQEVVHVDFWTGVLNTIILFASCLALWFATRKAAVDDVTGSKFWLITTVVFALAFLGVKSTEYYNKFEHGLYPNTAGPMIYEQADQLYLSQCVEKMRDITGQVGNGGESDAKRMDELNLIRLGVVQWTQHKVGVSDNSLMRNRAIEVLAHQIKPLEHNLDYAKFIEDEADEIVSQRKRLQSQLDKVNADLTASQSRLKELAKRKQESETPEIQEDFANESRIAENLTTSIGELRKEIIPLGRRLDAVELVQNSSRGINEDYHIQLPMVIPAGKAWVNSYYLLTGFHLLHMLAGLGVLLVWLFVRIGKDRQHLLKNFGLYWHFVDFVWLVIFVIIYLI